MQGLYDTHARDAEIDTNESQSDDQRPTDRRGHPDRRKKDRRNKERGKASDGLLQPILTQAEIAALLRGAR